MSPKAPTCVHRRRQSPEADSLSDFILGLMSALFRDIPEVTPADCDYFRSRLEREGPSFATKTLPLLGKEIDKTISDPGHQFNCTAFRRSKKTGALPLFLHGLTSKVISKSGYLLDPNEADVTSIGHLRQVNFFWYKLELPYTEKSLREAEEKLIQTDASLAGLEFGENHPFAPILEGARDIIQDVFRDINPVDITPDHGPGVVSDADRFEKSSFLTLYEALDEVFYYEVFCTLKEEYLERIKRERFSRKPWGRSKICFVPKDSRGPRVIGSEPAAYQYVQQGLGEVLIRVLERNRETRGRVNFTDQTVNRNLARISSVDRRFATLDLSEASDRVSLSLVRYLFSDTDLLYGLEAARTPETMLPSGQIIAWRKYAPMGSALCFPVMASVLYALTASTHYYFGGEFSERPYVYGDDLIVNKGLVEALDLLFNAVGLKLNMAKSCWKGYFRESCGADSFNGTDVTPVRAHKYPSFLLRQRRQFPITGDSSLISYTESSNQLLERGYFNASDYLRIHLEKHLGPMIIRPVGTEPAPLVLRSFSVHTAHIPPKVKIRWNKTYQRQEVLYYRVTPVTLECGAMPWHRFDAVRTGDSQGTVAYRRPCNTQAWGDWTAERVSESRRFAIPKECKITRRFVPVP